MFIGVKTHSDPHAMNLVPFLTDLPGLWGGGMLGLKAMLKHVVDHSQLYLKKVRPSRIRVTDHKIYTARGCTGLLRSLEFGRVQDAIHHLGEGCMCE